MRKKFALGLFTTIAAVVGANADIIPTLNPAAPAPESGAFRWNYATNVTVDETVNPGDFFTIYDFGDFVAGSNLQPTGWTFSSSLVGTNPSLVTPNDDPTLLNLTWTYTGTTPIVGSSVIGDFSVLATTNVLRTSHNPALRVGSAAPFGAGDAAGRSLAIPGTSRMFIRMPLASIMSPAL